MVAFFMINSSPNSIKCDLTNTPVAFFLEYAGGLHIIALREGELGQNSHTQRTTHTHTRLHHLPVVTGLYFYIFTFAPKTCKLRPAKPTPNYRMGGLEATKAPRPFAPASIQSSDSSCTRINILSTLGMIPLNTMSFLAFHRVHAPKTTKVLKPSRTPLFICSFAHLLVASYSASIFRR